MASSNSVSERKVMLIGKTGDGKSSAGNTILGEKVFIPKASANAATPEPVRKNGMFDGRKITVIDTPGFIDTDRDDEEIKSEVTKALIECAPSIDAFVIVLKVGRYTRHENEVVQQFLNIVTEDALKHTVILFTFGEQLQGQTIEEFVKPCSQLQELVNKCGGRCHVIDNKDWNNCHSGDKSNRVQVKNLMETIDKMVEENGHYSNELLHMVEEKIQEVMNINEDNLPPEEKREKAKKIVYQKILEQVAGAATGIVLGALLGAGVALASVVAVLRAIFPLYEQFKSKIPDAFGGTADAGGAATAIEAAVVGGEVVVGGAGAAAETGAVAGGAGVSVGMITARVLGAAAVVGAVEGGVTGWKAAEDADSVCDAMKKAATANYENATATVEKIQELVALALDTKQNTILKTLFCDSRPQNQS